MADIEGTASDAFNEWAIEIVSTVQAEVIPLGTMIDRLLKQGMSEQRIMQLIAADLETNPLFGKFAKNLVDKVVDPGVKRTMDRIAQEAWTDLDVVLEWQAVLDDRTCPDCKERHYDYPPATYDEWIELGLPTWGATICGFNCRCKLVPKGRKTTEPVRRARRKKGRK